MPERFGTMRPDLVVLGSNSFKVCEINARFSLNGYLMSVHLNEATRVQSVMRDSLTAQMCATSIPHTHSFVKDLRDRLTPRSSSSLNHNHDGLVTITVVSEQEVKKFDLSLLEDALNLLNESENRPQRFVVRFISPGQLSVDSNGDLCMAQSQQQQDCDCEMSIRIESCILELHQNELLALSPGILKGFVYVFE